MATTAAPRSPSALIAAVEALALIVAFGGGARWVRVDVVAVDITPDGATLTHYRNAVME